MQSHTVVTISPDELSEIIRSAVQASLHEAHFGQPQGNGRTGARRRKLISPKEIEEEFGISRRMLQSWRQDGIGPAFTNFGRRVFYERTGFEMFVASGQIQTKGLVDQ